MDTPGMANSRLRSADRWQLFADSTGDYAFILIDADNCIADWNSGAQQLLGYKAEDIVGRPAELLFTPEDRRSGAPAEEIATALRDGRAEDERWHVRQDGVLFRASGVLTVLRDESSQVIGFAKVMRDVSAREEARERLEQSLRERTTLLREVHHRVKSNLQMILSLIRLQADRIRDPRLLTAFEETQARVRAIAGVHERLYASPDFATIHLEPYLRALVYDVHSSHKAGDRIGVEIDVADLALEIDDAVPLGLIANELIGNAFEHAFPEGRRGTVAVKVSYQRRDGQNEPSARAQLEIGDDGVGLPAGFRLEAQDSLGFDLIRILTRQLRGEVAVRRAASGARFELSFPLTEE
jgi:PAS domain S-box-containing protein